MARKNTRNTKGKIVAAAWDLFYEQGYDNTTIDEIIELSGTSRGSFYHYFEGKDALLGTLSFVFDEMYEKLMETLDDSMNSIDKLIYLNQELFGMIENKISLDLLARLYSTQLITSGEIHLLDYNRTYYKVLRKIISRGQQDGEIRDDWTVNEIVKLYALCERGLIYDWCICSGEYSMKNYAKTVLPMFLEGIRKK